ncbi:MAG TPA: hypothetical protein VGJ94_13310 [Syntrophorhabdaceae bacterium]
METSFATTLFGTQASPLAASSGVNGTGKDPKAFLKVLKETMKGDSKGAHSHGTGGKGKSGTKAASADELATSLDILNALALLPVLLAARTSDSAGAGSAAGAEACSTQTMSDLLEAIAQALDTGNASGLLKALESDPKLRSLLSGGSGAPSGSSNPLQVISFPTFLGIGATVDNSPRTVEDSLAALLAVLKEGAAGLSSSADGAKALDLSVKSETKAPSSDSDPSRGADDAAKSAMLLGSLFPGLVQGSTAAATGPDQSGEQSTGRGSFPIPAEILAAIQSKTSTAIKGPAENSLSAGQGRVAEGLSEDYLLLNGKQAAQNTSSKGSSTFEEILSSAAHADEPAEADVPLAPLNGEILRGKGGLFDRLHEAHDRTGQAKSVSSGAEAGLNRQVDLLSDENPADPAALIENKDLLASLPEEKVSIKGMGDEAKAAKADVQGDPSDLKNDSRQLSGDAPAQVRSAQEKEQAGALAKGSYPSTMVSKIEEIAANYSARGHSADMVLRLNIDDRESILVGLKEQAGKVVVEVRAASEGIMNTLQLHKDAITRELEQKNIYTTIYVDSNGQENARNGGGRRERQERDGNKGNPEEFGSLFDTLA